MNKVRLLFVLAVFAASPFVHAADPLVKFPQGDASWTITFSYPGEKKEEPLPPGTMRVTKAEITRQGGVRRDRIWWSNAKTTEIWLLESARVRIYENPDNGGISVVPFNDSTMTSFIPRDFDESLFTWIAPQYRQDSEKRDGKECLVYAGNIARIFAVPGLTDKPRTLPATPHKAWIDAETKLPVAFDNSFTLQQFLFSPIPSEPLVMPERYQAELNRYLSDNAPSKRLERLRLRNARPRS